MSEIPNCFYRTSIKGLILNEELKFLLCKEITWKWELPWWGLDHWEKVEIWLRREFEEEMWVIINHIAENPSYFTTFVNNKEQPAANVIYQVSCDIAKILEFISSDECVEIWFFNIKEASELDLLPNVKEFVKIFNPSNHQ